jgi:hypothetical protein
VDDGLERQVLVGGEVGDHALAVLLGRDEHVAVEGLEALQERN